MHAFSTSISAAGESFLLSLVRTTLIKPWTTFVHSIFFFFDTLNSSLIHTTQDSSKKLCIILIQIYLYVILQRERDNVVVIPFHSKMSHRRRLSLSPMINLKAFLSLNCIQSPSHPNPSSHSTTSYYWLHSLTSQCALCWDIRHVLVVVGRERGEKLASSKSLQHNFQH